MKRWTLGLLGWIIPVVWAGEEPPPAIWHNMGRLFTTPELREMLEQMRQESRQPVTEVRQEKSREAEPEVDKPQDPPRIHVKGMLESTHGQKVVWLDGFNTWQGGENTPERVRIHLERSHRQGVMLALPSDPSTLVQLKPGQVLDTRENKILEGYQAPAPAVLPILGEQPASSPTPVQQSMLPPSTPEAAKPPINITLDANTAIQALQAVSPEAANTLQKVQQLMGNLKSPGK